MICRDCDKLNKIGNSEECGYGICTNVPYFFMVDMNEECVFEKPIILHCSNCSRFGTDFACETVEADNISENCPGFIDKREEGFRELLHFWDSRGIDVREKVEKILKEENF